MTALPISVVKASSRNLAYAEAVTKFGSNATVLNSFREGDNYCLTICEVDTEGLDRQMLAKAMEKPIQTLQSRSNGEIFNNSIASIMSLVQRRQSLKHDEVSMTLMKEKEFFEKLVGLGFDYGLVNELVSRADVFDLETAESALSKMLPDDVDDIIAKGGWVSFMGPTGVGKTTTLSKIASLYSKKFGVENLALVTVDTFRIGAVQQLKQVASILGVDFYVCDTPQMLKDVADKLSDKKLVLLDTAGSSQKDKLLHSQLKQYLDRNIKNLLVMNAGMQYEGLLSVIDSFSEFDVDSVILTKLDEVVKFGGALSAIVKSQLAVQYVTTGQNVPQDIERGSVTALLKRAMSC